MSAIKFKILLKSALKNPFYSVSQKNDEYYIQVGGGLIGYVKSKPFGTGQIISIDVCLGDRDDHSRFS